MINHIFFPQCDASESSSCTECTNRKVRCQFTKETNRRMSSIKFVPVELSLCLLKQVPKILILVLSSSPTDKCKIWRSSSFRRNSNYSSCAQGC